MLTQFRHANMLQQLLLPVFPAMGLHVQQRGCSRACAMAPRSSHTGSDVRCAPLQATHDYFGVFLRGEEGQSMNLTAAIKEATGAKPLSRLARTLIYVSWCFALYVI